MMNFRAVLISTLVFRIIAICFKLKSKRVQSLYIFVSEKLIQSLEQSPDRNAEIFSDRISDSGKANK